MATLPFLGFNACLFSYMVDPKKFKTIINSHEFYRFTENMDGRFMKKGFYEYPFFVNVLQLGVTLV